MHTASGSLSWAARCAPRVRAIRTKQTTLAKFQVSLLLDVCIAERGRLPSAMVGVDEASQQHRSEYAPPTMRRATQNYANVHSGAYSGACRLDALRPLIGASCAHRLHRMRGQLGLGNGGVARFSAGPYIQSTTRPINCALTLRIREAAGAMQVTHASTAPWPGPTGSGTPGAASAPPAGAAAARPCRCTAPARAGSRTCAPTACASRPRG